MVIFMWCFKYGGFPYFTWLLEELLVFKNIYRCIYILWSLYGGFPYVEYYLVI